MQHNAYLVSLLEPLEAISAEERFVVVVHAFDVDPKLVGSVASVGALSAGVDLLDVRVRACCSPLAPFLLDSFGLQGRGWLGQWRQGPFWRQVCLSGV